MRCVFVRRPWLFLLVAILALSEANAQSGDASEDVPKQAWIGCWDSQVHDLGGNETGIEVWIRPEGSRRPVAGYDDIYDANLTLTVQTGNGSQQFRRPLILDLRGVPELPPYEYGWWVALPVDLPSGTHNATLDLEFRGQVWHGVRGTIQVGAHDLRVQDGDLQRCRVTGLDVTGDGEADFFIRNATTGAPQAWGVTVRISAIETPQDFQRHLIVILVPLQYNDSAVIDLASDLVAALVRTSDLRAVWHDTNGATVERNGTHVLIRAGPIPPGHRTIATAFSALFSRSVPKEPPADLAEWGFGDGSRIHVNVTYLDLDRDGEADMRVWDANLSKPEEARAQNETARRTVPVQMVVHVVLEAKADGREAVFEFRRQDSERGVWVEFRKAGELFGRLMNPNAPPGTTDPMYSVPQLPNESVVDQRNETTWVWLGHFSTQYVHVFVPTAQIAVPSSPSVSPETTPGGAAPGLVLPLGVMTLFVSAMAARLQGRFR